jgi:hypothetical protein
MRANDKRGGDEKRNLERSYLSRQIVRRSWMPEGRTQNRIKTRRLPAFDELNANSIM